MIQLSNISKNFASQELFKNLNLKLNSRNRLGLVGRNGSGKSTLFKLILGEESADSGDIIVPKNYKIGALKQHLIFSEKTLRDEASLALEQEMNMTPIELRKFYLGLVLFKKI